MHIFETIQTLCELILLKNERVRLTTYKNKRHISHK
jgi:hypothetical protein